MDIKEISEKQSEIPIINKIITFTNVETEKVSILNISHRVFTDMLMHSCMADNLPQDINDRVFGDEKMMMWIARPTVTAVSFLINSYFSPKRENSKNLSKFMNFFLHSKLYGYVQVQDFTAVQILMTNLEPGLFLKYLLCNISPSIRDKEDIFHSISSILCHQGLCRVLNIKKLLILIYTAIIERHFIGVSEDPEYEFVERQVIHFLACDRETWPLIQEEIYMYRQLSSEKNPDFLKMLGKAIEKMTFTKSFWNEGEVYCLKPNCIKLVNVFYSIYGLAEPKNRYKYLQRLYRDKISKFELPDLVELRKNFLGMNNFVFSKEFSELIIYVVVKRYGDIDKPSSKGRVYGDLVIVVMILYQSLYSKYQQTLDFIFDNRQNLGNQNIMDIIVSVRSKMLDSYFNSVVDYLVELSLVERAYSDDLSQTELEKRISDHHILMQKYVENVDKIVKDWPTYCSLVSTQIFQLQVQGGIEPNLDLNEFQGLKPDQLRAKFNIFKYSTTSFFYAFARMQREAYGEGLAEVGFV
ncbi:hypothetical protein RF11_06716 [Thelohanellus kitauei]|uniref:Uncharacterized protein n=1 Tax=Thelohanellus kitauei TaxID=669202 RepID=A0A0C2MM33_THEKT|nr:hypothetical protein RF11_06716 [Thelohanellus kitauei]